VKRSAYLWDDMISFERLLHAAERARRGKRFKPEAGRVAPVLRFGAGLPTPPFSGPKVSSPGIERQPCSTPDSGHPNESPSSTPPMLFPF